MGPDMVVVNHEAPSLPPVLVDTGYDGGGFVEYFVPNALTSLDVTILDTAILFGTAWLDDLHGNAALLEEFSAGTAELRAVVGLAPG